MSHGCDAQTINMLNMPIAILASITVMLTGFTLEILRFLEVFIGQKLDSSTQAWFPERYGNQQYVVGITFSVGKR